MGRRGSLYRNLIFGVTLASFGRLGSGLAYAQQGLRLATEIDHQQWIAGAHDALARISLSLLAPEQALVSCGGRAHGSASTGLGVLDHQSG